ncbi:DUF2314 domain-containing protein [Aggregicoccus sp. 17bor-14]|uniref:DUF2314 domain-containing protein n=1 Tax=Myxococcaceae TaxID=31 RepID=UPI0012EEE18F|nr:DUF2314 domain-containing protein [Simulacricoccus sp. 17bor-14]MRI86800.1 DUF2314 domain-containing protein [Aggregicoccus sp. 17bor-14]
MKEVYLVATEAAQPLSLEQLRAEFESDEVRFLPSEDGRSFLLQADGTEVDVRFDSREAPMSWTPELLTGSDEAHAQLRRAHGFYRIAFEPGQPQATTAVFEALWCARALIEKVGGVLVDVTAYKLHEAADVEEITELEFDIRDHLNLHAVEATEGDTPLWVHTHGMEKFGVRDLEIFHLAEEDLLPAESFLHELCADLAFGQGPALRTQVETSEGQSFMLVPSEEARANLLGVPLDAFEGHEGLFLTAVSPLGRHNTGELLRPFRERFEKEPEERTRALRESAQALLPAFVARFHRRGLMEPLNFVARAPFETHPEGEPVTENLWLEVQSLEEDKVLGRLLDGAAYTTEWRKGAQVAVPYEQINALSLSREGRQLDDDEVRALLGSERPA